jgi:hypothetical protein
MEITGSVGMGCVNNRNDVLVVQDALKKKHFRSWLLMES